MAALSVDELADAVDLERRVCRVRREHVARDHRVALHPRESRSAAEARDSVTSGRAKKRNGTNVVPVPGDICIAPAAVS